MCTESRSRRPPPEDGAPVIRRPPARDHSLFPQPRAQPEPAPVSMSSLIWILMSQWLISTISALVLPSQYSQDPDYFLLPSNPVQTEDEDSYSQDDNKAIEMGQIDYEPTNEEILEALLTQMEYPEESESIYDSIMKREDENLSHQLSYLKELEQNIEERKEHEPAVKRRKRSIPPFIQSKNHRYGMH